MTFLNNWMNWCRTSPHCPHSPFNVLWLVVLWHLIDDYFSLTASSKSFKLWQFPFSQRSRVVSYTCLSYLWEWLEMCIWCLERSLKPISLRGWMQPERMIRRIQVCSKSGCNWYFATFTTDIYPTIIWINRNSIEEKSLSINTYLERAQAANKDLDPKRNLEKTTKQHQSYLDGSKSAKNCCSLTVADRQPSHLQHQNRSNQGNHGFFEITLTPLQQTWALTPTSTNQIWIK